MKCKKCERELSPKNKCGLCKVCKFKEKYPSVDYDRYNQFMKRVKAILKDCGVTYADFADLSGYEIATVDRYLSMKCYSKAFENATNEVLRKLGH